MKKNKEWKVKPSQKKFLAEQIEELKEVFFLQGWEIPIHISKNPHETSPDIDAEVTTTWRYRRAEIYIYPRFWESPLAEQKQTLVHEFCHVVTERPFALLSAAQKGNFVSEGEYHDVLEYVATWLEGIITRLR